MLQREWEALHNDKSKKIEQYIEKLFNAEQHYSEVIDDEQLMTGDDKRTGNTREEYDKVTKDLKEAKAPSCDKIPSNLLKALSAKSKEKLY